MSYELIIFTSESISNVSSKLTLGDGNNVNGHPAVHPTGRQGIGFTIPDNTPNGWQALLELTSPDKVKIEQKAILWLNDGSLQYPWTKDQTAAFAADDFYFQPVPVVIPPVPTPIPPVNHPCDDPLAILHYVYNSGSYDLSTKDGCGRFTEDSCKGLHENCSKEWGNVRKLQGQNQYNGHAVDAIMLLAPYGMIRSGIYDIIVSSESSNAKIAFNRVGDPVPQLWYYPA